MGTDRSVWRLPPSIRVKGAFCMASSPSRSTFPSKLSINWPWKAFPGSLSAQYKNFSVRLAISCGRNLQVCEDSSDTHFASSIDPELRLLKESAGGSSKRTSNNASVSYTELTSPSRSLVISRTRAPTLHVVLRRKTEGSKISGKMGINVHGLEADHEH